MDKGFELPYKLGEELRREELISDRPEQKRKVYPYMSDLWNIFPSVWSPIDTIKEKYKLQGLAAFLPSVGIFPALPGFDWKSFIIAFFANTLPTGILFPSNIIFFP